MESPGYVSETLPFILKTPLTPLGLMCGTFPVISLEVVALPLHYRTVYTLLSCVETEFPPCFAESPHEVLLGEKAQGLARGGSSHLSVWVPCGCLLTKPCEDRWSRTDCSA